MSNSDQKLTRTQRREKIKRQKQMQSVGIMILGVLIIVGGIVIASFAKPSVSASKIEANYEMANGNGLGDPNAPVVLEVYSNFLCSHCLNFALEKEAMLIDEYVTTGKVYFVYRPFNSTPLDEAGVAAQAAYCAGDENKFWEMHDIIFSNYNTGYTNKRLASMADKIGLNVSQFNECLTSGKYESQIESDFQKGVDAGISGTPSFTINGVFKIEGDQAYSVFQQQIELALQEAGN